MFNDLLWLLVEQLYRIHVILGILGIYLRIKSFESPTFLKDKHTAELPAKVVFTRFKQQLFLSVIITSILAMSNYVLIAYVTTFLVKSEYFLLKDALLINLIALALLTVLIPLMGFLSDVVGRKPIFLIGLFALCLLIFPFFWLLLSGSWWQALCSELLLAIALAPINATVPTIIAEMFPTSVRASGISISYNIGQALFGGTMPLVAFTLIELSSNKMAPTWYLFLWTLIVIPITISIRESYQKELT
ncbi:MFS transporter [Legionella pneumophila serogroup 10]